MRSKLILGLLIATILGLFVALIYVHSLSVSEGRYPKKAMMNPLAAALSVEGIEKYFNQLGFPKVPRHDVVAGNSRFVFYAYYPYREKLCAVLYCYEQVTPDLWDLRGYFPVSAGGYLSVNGEEIEYQPKNDSVDILCKGKLLISIKSSTSHSRHPL